MLLIIMKLWPVIPLKLLAKMRLPKIYLNNFEYKFINNNFPRYRDDYRGTFIGTLVEVLSQKNKKLKIRVIVPSSKHSLLYEKWGNIKIHRFKYWINQNQQCIAYGDYTLANLKKSIFALIQFPFYIIIFFLKTLKYWNVTSIFHCQWTITAIFPIVINKLLFFKPDKPIIITCRGSDLRSLPGWLNRFLLKNSIAVTYPSPLFTMRVGTINL